MTAAPSERSIAGSFKRIDHSQPVRFWEGLKPWRVQEILEIIDTGIWFRIQGLSNGRMRNAAAIAADQRYLQVLVTIWILFLKLSVSEYTGPDRRAYTLP